MDKRETITRTTYRSIHSTMPPLQNRTLGDNSTLLRPLPNMVPGTGTHIRRENNEKRSTQLHPPNTAPTLTRNIKQIQLIAPQNTPQSRATKPTPYQQLIASHISKHTTIHVRAAALLLTRKRRWKQQMYTPATSKKAALRPADQKSILDFFSPPHNLDPHK